MSRSKLLTWSAKLDFCAAMNRWDPYRTVPVVIFADPSEGPPYYVPYYDKQGVLKISPAF